jgi:T5SS/PEP-CTERM-associated repeat protein/autotransporter-associated beta strand protein
MQCIHRTAHRQRTILSDHSLPTRAMSDAPVARGRAAAAPRQCEAEAGQALATAMKADMADGPARTADWMGGHGSTWFSPANWSAFATPAAGTDLRIGIRVPVEIEEGDAVCRDMVVGGAGGASLTISGGGTVSGVEARIGREGGGGTVTVVGLGLGSRWNTHGLYVGDVGSGTLEIRDGGLVESASGSIGSQAGSCGDVTVTGVDSTGASSSWIIDAGNLVVGDVGGGTLLVELGGTVRSHEAIIGNAADSTGSKATVTGDGSTWTNEGPLYVGDAGSGALDILGGGRVETESGCVGYRVGAEGEVKVAGTDSSWIHTAGLWVGYRGVGTLAIEVGGLVRGVDGYIGAETGSVGAATVTGSGSGWISTGHLLVGGLGTGALRVRDRGLVRGACCWIGNSCGSKGEVMVTGAGSHWIISREQTVGLRGAGELTIAEGGRVEVQAGHGDSRLALFDGSSGTLNIGTGGAAGVLVSAAIIGGDGIATLNFNHDEARYAFTSDGTAAGAAILIGGSTAVNQIGSGTTTLLDTHTYTGATTVSAGTLLVEGALGDTAIKVCKGGTLGGSGSIAGAVTIADGGILAPGSSAGTLTLGALTLDGRARLDYPLGQAGNSVNGLVEVVGDLVLDGRLDITDIGGFGAGVYRLINYSGDLIDNGLEVGSVPEGIDRQDLFVQTAIHGQVNLVNRAGLAPGCRDGSVSAGHFSDVAVGDGVDAASFGNGACWRR